MLGPDHNGNHPCKWFIKCFRRYFCGGKYQSCIGLKNMFVIMISLYIVPKLSRNRSVPVLKMEASSISSKKRMPPFAFASQPFPSSLPQREIAKFFFILGIFGAIYCDVRRREAAPAVPITRSFTAYSYISLERKPFLFRQLR